MKKLVISSSGPAAEFPGPLHPPHTITIEGRGEVAALYPSHLGTFTQTDEWVNGWPVYQNEEDKILLGGGEDYCLIGQKAWIRSWFEEGHRRVWEYRGADGHPRRSEDITLTATFSPTKLR